MYEVCLYPSNVRKVLLVLEIRRFQHTNVVFCQLNISHVQMQRVAGDIGVGVGGSKAWDFAGGKFASFHRATTPSKGFLFTFNHYTCASYSLYVL